MRAIVYLTYATLVLFLLYLGGVLYGATLEPTRDEIRKTCDKALIVWDNKRCGGPR